MAMGLTAFQENDGNGVPSADKGIDKGINFGYRVPEVIVMQAAIQKGENSRGIPLRKAPGTHRSFEERFAEQFGVPAEESSIRFDNEESDWGEPMGAERW